MTVQELIDELNKIEDKSKTVTYNVGACSFEVDAIFDEYEDKIELM